MLIWTGATRFPAIAKSGINLSKLQPGGRGQDLDAILPPSINWKSHNHTHLHEQPTLFYAVVAILAIGGGVTTLTVGLAWAYVALRIVHSFWQSLVNTIPVRATLYFTSAACLTVLAICAVLLTLA
jgi:hypothetical protein